MKSLDTFLRLLVVVVVVQVAACFTDTTFWPKQRPEEDLVCEGQCVPAPDFGWTDPVLFWMGEPGKAPSCPLSAPTLVYEGFTGLDIFPISCPVCECSDPVATCDLSLEWNAYNAYTCDDGIIVTSFDAPLGWDGSCTTANSIPSGAQCIGVPCVESVGVDRPIFESHCVPTPPAPPTFGSSPWPWTKEGRACMKAAQCPDPNAVCLPTRPNASSDNWLSCIFQSGHHECPGEYMHGYTFYQDVDTSAMSCIPCTCSDPPDASCIVYASAYTDDQCSVPVFENLMVTPKMSGKDTYTCVAGLLPGTALGSKKASLLVDPGGPCVAEGGEVEGKPELIEPVTFCCL